MRIRFMVVVDEGGVHRTFAMMEFLEFQLNVDFVDFHWEIAEG